LGSIAALGKLMATMYLTCVLFVAIVPLHAAALLGHAAVPVFPAGAWRDTTVCLPAPLASIPLHSVFDGQTLCGARLALGQTLGALPVALLHG
ncbi:hypothetical protein ACQUWS_21930, partial [Ralstonia pseudosolanacearum]|uniref:hypothetical protein n=1 Tax=Ralstonia pseudosolanacearum TaxID=1310165 RepID=UPI003D168BBF